MPNRAFHCLDGTPLRRPETALGGGARVVWNDGLLDAYLGWARQTGFRDYAVRIAGRLHVVAVERESVRAVLNDQADFQRNIAPTKHLFGAGMLRLTGEAWRVRRVMTTPPFRREGLGSAQPIVVDEVDRLLDRWRARGGEPFRPSRDLSRCMASILGRYLFGFELGAQDRPALHQSLIALSVDSVLRHLLPRPAAILLNRWAVHRARRVLDALCGEILDRGGKTVFLEALRAAMAAGQLDRRTAIDEIRTFLIAGYETSATALSWMIAVLAERPEIQEDLRQESCGVDLRGGAPTDLLVRTTAVIRESLRLYPAVPISVSVAVRDARLGGYLIPKGTRVDVASYVVHRCPQRFEDPERFDPLRFTEGVPGTDEFLPFLGGPHLCLGRGLAMIELRAATAMILERFELSAPQGPPTVNLRLSLHPRGLVIAARERR